MQHDRAPVVRELVGCHAQRAKRLVLHKIDDILKLAVDRKERERSDAFRGGTGPDCTRLAQCYFWIWR